MDLTQFLADPRRRNLGILAAIAVVSLLLAVAALWRESIEGRVRRRPISSPASPGRCATPRASMSSRNPAPSTSPSCRRRAGSCRSAPTIRRPSISCSAPWSASPRCAPSSPRRRGRTGCIPELDTPPAGDGVLIAVADDKGRPLAAVIAGKSEDIGDSTGATGLFVRRPGREPELAGALRHGPAPRPVGLARQACDGRRPRPHPRGRCRSGRQRLLCRGPRQAERSRFHPDADPRRQGGERSDRSRRRPPPRSPISASTMCAPARELDFNDPRDRAAGDPDLRRARRDGACRPSGGDCWAQVSAEAAAPSTPDTAKEAAAINAHASGWAYKLAAFKGQLFMTTLDSLLRAPPAGACPGAAPAMTGIFPILGLV